MSLQQLGKKLNMTKQGVMDLERREQEGSITLKSLRATAGALDMDLVYALVPRDGSLDALIERRATELATTIVLRTAVTMQLEGQANTPERLEAAIRERATLLRATSPKLLWD
jgi:predicted DNA-binding mobile mystery protein A